MHFIAANHLTGWFSIFEIIIVNWNQRGKKIHNYIYIERKTRLMNLYITSLMYFISYQNYKRRKERMSSFAKRYWDNILKNTLILLSINECKFIMKSQLGFFILAMNTFCQLVFPLRAFLIKYYNPQVLI